MIILSTVEGANMNILGSTSIAAGIGTVIAGIPGMIIGGGVGLIVGSIAGSKGK